MILNKAVHSVRKMEFSYNKMIYELKLCVYVILTLTIHGGGALPIANQAQAGSVMFIGKS